jgi:hypothetical protein
MEASVSVVLLGRFLHTTTKRGVLYLWCSFLAFHSEFLFLCIYTFYPCLSLLQSLYVYSTFVRKSLRYIRVMMEEGGYVVSHRWFHDDVLVDVDQDEDENATGWLVAMDVEGAVCFIEAVSSS